MAKIKVYTKHFCPYCIKAKMLLKSKKQDFEEIELKSQDEMMALVEKTGMMTVPQIFINDELIGGFDDMDKLNREGKLDGLLALL